MFVQWYLMCFYPKYMFSFSFLFISFHFFSFSFTLFIFSFSFFFFLFTRLVTSHLHLLPRLSSLASSSSSPHIFPRCSVHRTNDVFIKLDLESAKWSGIQCVATMPGIGAECRQPIVVSVRAAYLHVLKASCVNNLMAWYVHLKRILHSVLVWMPWRRDLYTDGTPFLLCATASIVCLVVYASSLGCCQLRMCCWPWRVCLNELNRDMWLWFSSYQTVKMEWWVYECLRLYKHAS